MAESRIALSLNSAMSHTGGVLCVCLALGVAQLRVSSSVYLLLRNRARDYALADYRDIVKLRDIV